MARGVRVFGTERGAEGVDAAQRECAQLAFELARHREVARLAEEVLRIVDRPLPGPGQVVHIERRHLEHRAGAFAVRSRDDRGVEIVESVFVEIFVDGVSHGVTDAEHRAERVGARTQVGDFAQKLQRMPLLLQGIALGVGRTVNLDFFGLHLDALPRARRSHQTAVDAETGARGHGLELLLGDFGQIDHHLYITYARPVVQGDERHVLVTALGAHPAFYDDVGIDSVRFQDFYDSLRFHISILSVFPVVFSELTKLTIICDLSKKKYLWCRNDTSMRRNVSPGRMQFRFEPIQLFCTFVVIIHPRKQ